MLQLQQEPATRTLYLIPDGWQGLEVFNEPDRDGLLWIKAFEDLVNLNGIGNKWRKQ